jgi:hypothetical protein
VIPSEEKKYFKELKLKIRKKMILNHNFHYSTYYKTKVDVETCNNYTTILSKKLYGINNYKYIEIIIFVRVK